MTDDVLFTREKHLGLITLNRSNALNALTLPMILAIQEQLEAWETDNSIHAVVVKAAEGRAFCAGGDVRWLYEKGLERDPVQMDFFWHEYHLNHFIYQLHKPYIALMDGITMGGGVGISLHGSHPVATERFSFAMPETAIGFFPDIGASHLLSRCPDEFGTYLALTGQRLNAQDAKTLGLVRYVVNSVELNDVIEALMTLDLRNNADKKVDECLAHYIKDVDCNEIRSKSLNVREIFSKHEVEDIFAALNKSDSSWHKETLASLESKAPLSLKITRLQMEKSRTMNLAQCLEMDFNLVTHFMQGSDFYEGVRALLVDKDKQPNWQPKTLEATTHSMVLKYFEPVTRRLQLLS